MPAPLPEPKATGLLKLLLLMDKMIPKQQAPFPGVMPADGDNNNGDNVSESYMDPEYQALGPRDPSTDVIPLPLMEAMFQRAGHAENIDMLTPGSDMRNNAIKGLMRLPGNLLDDVAPRDYATKQREIGWNAERTGMRLDRTLGGAKYYLNMLFNPELNKQMDGDIINMFGTPESKITPENVQWLFGNQQQPPRA